MELTVVCLATEDGMFRAQAVELDGCVAAGRSAEEALLAVKGALADALADGIPVRPGRLVILERVRVA